MKEMMKDFLGKVDMLQFLTAVCVLAAFIGTVFALLFRPIPEANKDAVMLIIGMIDGAVITMVSFYYGSSKGSQKKSDVISKAMDIIIPEEPKP